MIDHGTLGRIPPITERKRMIASEGKHGLDRSSGTKESNVISKKQAVKSSKRIGISRRRDGVSGRSGDGTEESRE